MLNYLPQCLRKLRPNTYLILGIILLLVPAMVIFLILGKIQPDIHFYYEYSLNIFKGKIPYRDFTIEYPPLALIPMVVAQLLNSILFRSLEGYFICFAIQNIFLCILTGLLTIRLVENFAEANQKSVYKAATVFVLLTAFNALSILGRYDIFPALLTILALWLISQDRPAECGVFLGLGFLAKLYPILFVPIFAVFYLARHKYIDLIKLLSATAGSTLLVIFLFLPVGINNLLYFAQYHKNRGLHIETLPAGLMMLAHRLGEFDLETTLNYGAYHLKSSMADGLLHWLSAIFLILFILTTLKCFVNFSSRGKSSASLFEALAFYMAMSMTVFIVCNKVFSPQYFIWLMPFIPLLSSKLSSSFLIANLLTFIGFPFLYDSFLQMKLLPILVFNVRNFLLLFVMIYMLSAPQAKARIYSS